MKTSTVLAAVAATLILIPARAHAQQLNLEMHNGLVTLQAQNVPVRQILAEWARIGGATIVNGDKVMGGPVTLQLNAVPERQALDVILRGVSGYMLASRQTPAPGLSGFDRILIMPTSAPPRTPPPATAFTGRPMPRPMPQPDVAPVEDVVPDGDHDEPAEAEAEMVEEEPPQPQPGMNPRFQRPQGFPNPMGGVPTQPFSPQGFPVPQENEEGAPAQTAPSSSPFNVPPGATTVPGVIAPVPQQEEQAPPPTRTRRPPQ